MALITHLFDPPERFVAGTVGVPGERSFFLQARSGARVTSVLCEKQQVEILGERVGELLDEVAQSADLSSRVPALTPVSLIDDGPLEQPIVEEFRAGTIQLSWNEDDERVVIEVFPVPDLTAVDEAELAQMAIEEPAATEVFVVRLTAAMARAFATRAQQVVAGGRPPCPFCGQPLDPEGHLCPRANGFRRRAE